MINSGSGRLSRRSLGVFCLLHATNNGWVRQSRTATPACVLNHFKHFSNIEPCMPESLELIAKISKIWIAESAAKSNCRSSHVCLNFNKQDRYFISVVAANESKIVPTNNCQCLCPDTSWNTVERLPKACSNVVHIFKIIALELGFRMCTRDTGSACRGRFPGKKRNSWVWDWDKSVRCLEWTVWSLDESAEVIGGCHIKLSLWVVCKTGAGLGDGLTECKFKLVGGSKRNTGACLGRDLHWLCQIRGGCLGPVGNDGACLGVGVAAVCQSEIMSQSLFESISLQLCLGDTLIVSDSAKKGFLRAPLDHSGSRYRKMRLTAAPSTPESEIRKWHSKTMLC